MTSSWGQVKYTGDFTPLRTTKNDPFRMKDFLLDEVGFDHVHVLTDEKVTSPRVRELMEGKFRNLVESDDRFLFYWSGHGTQVKNALNRVVGYLPLADSKRDQTYTMISMGDVADWDGWIKARHALFLLDACFSGLAGSEPQSTPKDFTIERLSKPAHHLISAGTGDEQTIAGEDWNGSIFTDAIIRGARGEADAQTAFPADGVVSIAELLEFVRQRVDHERRRKNWDKEITPQWNYLRSSPGEFFFVTSEKKIEVARVGGETTGEFDYGTPVVVMDLDPSEPDSCDAANEWRFWDSIKSERQPAYFEAYLARVQSGEFCGTFREIAELKVAALPPKPTDQTSPLKLSPERIKQAQEMLAALSFDPGKADGVLGARTRAAIIAFQRSIGSKVTGTFTEADEIALAMAFADLVQSGGSTGAVDEEAQTAGVGVFPSTGTMTPGKTFQDCPECPEMVVVPPGSFMMGSPSDEEGRDVDESPQHSVTIGRSFAIGRFEVTRAEYAAFAQATGRGAGDGCFIWSGGELKTETSRSWRDPGFSQTERDPVVCVNWRDAKAYVSWLSRRTGKRYRLLSEAEWEYVARAGTTTARYWGELSSIQCDHANGADKTSGLDWAISCTDGASHTSPVGSYGHNVFGLSDVLGNVREWAEDCWNESYVDAPSDGTARESGECSRRVMRGGSWISGPRYLRSADRFGNSAGGRLIFGGFRVARTL